jgi:hypothetical protein
MPRKAAALLLRPMVQTISTAAVTTVPFTNLSLGAILADRGCMPTIEVFFEVWISFEEEGKGGSVDLFQLFFLKTQKYTRSHD